MRYSLRAVGAFALAVLLAACAEQEMDSAEMDNAAHTPAAAPATTSPADSAGGHAAHATDSISTTTSH